MVQQLQVDAEQHDVTALRRCNRWCTGSLQVSDEDDAAVAVALADKLEAAVASELVLPQKHGLTPNPSTLLNAEVE